MKTKLILLFAIISITLSACSSENKIDITSKSLINEDLSDDISINECLYNEESNAVYVKFHSFEHGNDEAIILLDDNSIFYSSVYSTIKEDDYDKIIEYGDYAICGTRGWFFEEDRSGQHDEKVFKRELIRLETSLKAAGERQKLVFLHYPPRYKGYECQEILGLLEKYGVRSCYYGHLHGGSHKLAMEGQWDGVEFRLVAADYIGFHPYKVL